MTKSFRYSLLIAYLFSAFSGFAQHTKKLADSIRNAYKMPELAYAVVSAGKVYEEYYGGTKKAGTDATATPSDRFRLGSNTKPLTAYLAALQVKRGNIKWDTRFFDLFPGMKPTARKEFHNLTLLDLLTFRTHILAWIYTNPTPVKEDFQGNDSMQRVQFMQWCFSQPPVRMGDSICFSNPGYVAAGLMLEKASGRSYTGMLKELSDNIGAGYEIGQPNVADANQVWGHNGVSFRKLRRMGTS